MSKANISGGKPVGAWLNTRSNSAKTLIARAKLEVPGFSGHIVKFGEQITGILRFALHDDGYCAVLRLYHPSGTRAAFEGSVTEASPVRCGEVFDTGNSQDTGQSNKTVRRAGKTGNGRKHNKSLNHRLNGFKDYTDKKSV